MTFGSALVQQANRDLNATVEKSRRDYQTPPSMSSADAFAAYGTGMRLSGIQSMYLRNHAYGRATKLLL